MALVTTARKPCTRTRAFSRELAGVLPLSQYLPRGKSSVEELISEARRRGMQCVAIVSDIKGNPGKMEFLDVSQSDWQWSPTVLLLRGVKLQREFGKKRLNGDNELALEGDGTVAELLGIEGFPDAEMAMSDKDGRVTFLAGDEEVGPAFKYEAKPWK